MPNRIIKESCRTSITLDKLSDGAERMFWRLTTVADDFGRFESHPNVLLAQCFPLRVDSLKIKQVRAWFNEMIGCGLVTTYVVNGKQLGFFNTWSTHQRKRAENSKYPAPSSDNICCQPLSNASESSIRGIEESRNESRKSVCDESGGQATADVSRFELFWKEYPNKTGKGAAEKAWWKAQITIPVFDLILTALETQKQSEKWTKDNGQFIPNPATWINQRRWEDEARAESVGSFFTAAEEAEMERIGRKVSGQH